MTISIVIPAHNEEKYIADCLQSIFRWKTANVIEIIVVDNASTDATVTIAKRFPGVHVVHEYRKGTGFARNAGFRHATGDLVAFLDADSRIVSRQWFALAEETFRTSAQTVCLTGPLIFYDLPVWQQYSVYYWWMMLAIPSYALTGRMVVGGNFVARRAVLESIGGIDTSIAFYGDDTNIARRLAQVGTVKMRTDFLTHSSARRLKGQGFWKTGSLYAMNYLSELCLHTPVTRTYANFR